MDNNRINQLISVKYKLPVMKTTVLRDGSDNTVYLLEEKGRQKFVARLSKRQEGNDIAFEAEWLRFLKRKKIPVVPAVRNKDGKDYTILPNGSAVTLFEFVSGKNPVFNVSAPPFSKAVASAAQTLALIHDASRKHIVPLSRRRTIYTELERAIAYEKIPGGQGFIKKVRKFVKMQDSSKNVLIHNDYRINNLLFDEKGAVAAVLDFDWCCMGPAIKDVAHALAEWSFPDGASSHWEYTFSVFLENYNKIAKEKIKNNERLYQWIAFSCLSDTCTYLIDRLERGEIKPVDDSYMYRKFLYFQSK